MMGHPRHGGLGVLQLQESARNRRIRAARQLIAAGLFFVAALLAVAYFTG